MSKPVNKTLIGIFVAGAIALFVVAIAVLGSGKFFKERYLYVMVFEGSIKGLNVGAPVVFRGVHIGAVSDTRLHFDIEKNTMGVLVYVEMEKGRVISPEEYERISKKMGGKTQYDIVKELIAEGLRAQLEMQSFVTGQLEISVDFHPEKPAVYTGIDKSVMEIPTIPTPFQVLTRKLESLPLEDLFSKVHLAVEGISAFIQSPELKEGIANFNVALKDVQSLLRNVDAQVKPLGTGLSKTVKDTQRLVRNMDSQVASLGANLQETLGDGRKLIGRVDGSVESLRSGALEMMNRATDALTQAGKVLAELKSSAEGDSALMYRLTESLREVERSARAMRSLADYLDRHPESLLRGKGESGGK